MKGGFRVINKQTGDQFFEGCYIDSIGKLWFESRMDGRLDRPSGKQDLVVQYSTGLFDVEGNEIFEGDIVAWEENAHTRVAPVVFSPTVSAFVLDVSGRHLIDGKYGDYQHLHKETPYKTINR